MSSFVKPIKYSSSQLFGNEKILSITNKLVIQAKIRFVFLIDNSGSMAGSRLNLVKHACKSIIKSSNENIEISIFTFSTRGVMIQTFYIMNNHNKEIFIKDIDNIQTDGTTNLHLGLDVSMNYIKHYPNPENIITHLLVFTDGEPDKKELHIYENLLKPFYMDNKNPCTIDVFGFGNYLLLDVLKTIYTIGDGIFGYISDINMIGTIFGNYFANVVSTTINNVTIRYELEDKDKDGEIIIKTIDVGDIQSMQTKYYILEIPEDYSIGFTSIEYSYYTYNIYSDQEEENKIIERIEELPQIDVEEYQIELIKLRINIIDILNNFINNKNTIINAKQSFEDIYNIFYEKFLLNNDLLIYESVKEIQKLLFDIKSNDIQKGQIMRAFDNYNTWGKYYLISLFQAHLKQNTINFKDDSIQIYSGTISKQLYEEFNTIFNTIPFIEINYSSSSVSNSYTNTTNTTNTTAADYNYRGGGCFDENMIVHVMDNNLDVHNIKLKDLKKGDTLIDSHGKLKNIEFILKTKYVNQKMYNLNGVIGTETHPIFIKDEWIKMKDAENVIEIKNYQGRYLYSFSLLNIEETMNNSLSFEINEIPCAAFGHGDLDKDIHNKKYSILSSTFWGLTILNIFKKLDNNRLLIDGTLTLDSDSNNDYEYIRDNTSGWCIGLKYRNIIY